MSLEVLRSLRDTDALLEVNTGGVARGYMTDPYPARFLLKEWRAWGGEVIIKSDCHYAPLIDAGFENANTLLLSLGYEHVVRLNKNPVEDMWERVKF